MWRKKKKGRFSVIFEGAALINHTMCESESVCLKYHFNCVVNKVNELDDKIVWTTMLALETDGQKKWKSSRTQVHEQRTRRRTEARREGGGARGNIFCTGRIEEERRRDIFYQDCVCFCATCIVGESGSTSTGHCSNSWKRSELFLWSIKRLFLDQYWL